jgi:hypothetical protein
VAGSLEINQRSAVAGGPETVFFKTSEKNFAPWLFPPELWGFFCQLKLKEEQLTAPESGPVVGRPGV